MSTLDKAISIAAQAFEGRFDKAGRPYILHCLYVMRMVELNQGDDEQMSIAVMHDLIEDCPDWTLERLLDEGFSVRVVNALDCLTHRDDEDYMEGYIRRVATNHDATKVKIADLDHNSNIQRMKGIRRKDFDRMEKYHRAYAFLTGKEVEDVD